MLAILPLLIAPVALYNLAALTFPGGLDEAGAAARLAAPLLTARLASGATWSFGLGDLLIVLALIALFVEFVRPAGTAHGVILHRSLSVALLVVCLMEFLLLPAFATSTFLLIGLMVVLDPLAGLVLAFAGAARD